MLALLTSISLSDVLAYLKAFVVVLGALVALIHALIALCMLIPGEQPEKMLQAIVDKLQSVVDFVSKYSK